MPAGEGDDERGERGGACDRASLHRSEGRVRADRGKTGLRGQATDAQLPAGAQGSGTEVVGVGKIEDLFGGVGVSRSLPGASNAQALGSVRKLVEELKRGLVFVNLIETDQVYGHRKDVEGFHRALREIDAEVGRMLGALRPEDLLIVTADHGVDPAHPGTDHTREFVPLLAVTGSMVGEDGFRHDGPMADVGATVLHWLTGHESESLPGSPFLLS